MPLVVALVAVAAGVEVSADEIAMHNHKVAVGVEVGNQEAGEDAIAADLALGPPAAMTHPYRVELQAEE